MKTNGQLLRKANRQLQEVIGSLWAQSTNPENVRVLVRFENCELPQPVVVSDFSFALKYVLYVTITWLDDGNLIEEIIGFDYEDIRNNTIRKILAKKTGYTLVKR